MRGKPGVPALAQRRVAGCGRPSPRPWTLRHLALLLSLLLAVASLSAACGRSTPTRLADNVRDFYEIFVRSYYDSDGNGLGDLAGVTAKLGYIADDLGAGGIWLMPVMPSPSYHKYDITDYLAIDPQYGTLADFDKLVAEAHKRDIRVIMDLVLNHTSNLHPWFDQAVQALWKGEASPYIDYYHFTKDNLGQGYSKITDQYYYECRFVPGMPDLNLDSAAVRQEISGIVRFWLDRGVDGFRLDAVTSYYTGEIEKNIAFLSWLNGTVKSIKPDAYLIGEAWSSGSDIVQYCASGIDSFFNFPCSQATGRLVEAINSQDGSDFATYLADWDSQIRKQNPAALDALFLSNHDQARSAGFLARSLAKEKMAAALYLLAPGNPFIYYGEEIGMNGSGADENKRLPMLWSLTDKTGITYPPPNATQTVNEIVGVDKQRSDAGSLLNFYRSILAIKLRNPEIARGRPAALDAGNPAIFALTLTYQDRAVTVLHNLGGETTTIDLAALGLAKASLADSLTTDQGKVRKTGNKLVLPVWSTAILR
jgi:alpha-amylase